MVLVILLFIPFHLGGWRYSLDMYMIGCFVFFLWDVVSVLLVLLGAVTIVFGVGSPSGRYKCVPRVLSLRVRF